MECVIIRFGAYAKLGHAVDSLEEHEALQRDLNRLDDWAIINSMKFRRTNAGFRTWERVTSDLDTSWESGWRATR